MKYPGPIETRYHDKDDGLMRQGMSSRRARGRGNSRGGRQQNIRNQQMDSNGPGGRIRGTPQQVLDRYLALARDASSAGDSVLAENLFQHAEHYARMLNAAAPPQQQNQQHQANGRDDQSFEDGDADSERDSRQPEQGEKAASAPQERRRQPQEANGEMQEQPSAPAAPPEWSAGDQPPAGDQLALEQPAEEQPASPPRRRRRSRFQRQQEQEGADNAAPQAADANANGNGADTNPVPPIDLSAAAAEPAPAADQPREPGEQPLV